MINKLSINSLENRYEIDIVENVTSFDDVEQKINQYCLEQYESNNYRYWNNELFINYELTKNNIIETLYYIYGQGQTFFGTPPQTTAVKVILAKEEKIELEMSTLSVQDVYELINLALKVHDCNVRTSLVVLNAQTTQLIRISIYEPTNELIAALNNRFDLQL